MMMMLLWWWWHYVTIVSFVTMNHGPGAKTWPLRDLQNPSSKVKAEIRSPNGIKKNSETIWHRLNRQEVDRILLFHSCTGLPYPAVLGSQRKRGCEPSKSWDVEHCYRQKFGLYPPVIKHREICLW